MNMSRTIVVACSITLVCIVIRRASSDELPRATPAEVGLSSAKLDKIRSVVQAAVDKGQTTGAVVLVARHGKVVSLDAIGRMDGGNGPEVRPDTLFRIYSMTKPITSVAALMLVEKGRIKLDDAVSLYLPEFKEQRVYTAAGTEGAAVKREMTIRDLMRHTSGLTYGMPNGTAVDKLYIANDVEDGREDLATMVRKLGKLPLQDQPGARFNYSLSTDVLGRIIEVAAGQPLDTYMRNRIFKPLDMRDTGFEVDDVNVGRFATRYQMGRNGTLVTTETPSKSHFRMHPKLLSGGGGLVSTARDYARFCQMLLNGGKLGRARLLRPETVREMTTNQLPPEAMPMSLGGFRLPNLGFGLGVSVQLEPNSSTAGPNAGEYGWSGAASTFFWVAPRADLFVVILQQVEPLNIGLQLALKPLIYSAIEK